MIKELVGRRLYGFTIEVLKNESQMAKILGKNYYTPLVIFSMSATRVSALTEPKMISISSRLRPLVSGSRLAVQFRSTNGEQEVNVILHSRRKDSHSTDVNGAKHEKELETQICHQVGGNLGNHKVCIACRHIRKGKINETIANTY